MPNTITINELEITFLGWSSFRIKARGLTMYINPADLGEIKVEDKAELVLVSNSHEKNCKKEDLQKIMKEDTKVFGPQKVEDLLGPMVTVVAEGDLYREKGVEFRVVPAYNEGSSFNPRDFGYGFEIKVLDQKIYFAGDTDLIPEVQDRKEVDIAMLPIGGTDVMDYNDAADALSKIKPKYVIPYHYELGVDSPIESFKHLASNISEVIVLT